MSRFSLVTAGACILVVAAVVAMTPPAVPSGTVTMGSPESVSWLGPDGVWTPGNYGLARHASAVSAAAAQSQPFVPRFGPSEFASLGGLDFIDTAARDGRSGPGHKEKAAQVASIQLDAAGNERRRSRALAPRSVSPRRAARELGRDDIRRSIDAQLPRVRACYERTLKQGQVVFGRMQLAWSIEPDGRVTSARLSRDGVGDPALRDCVVRELSGWRFPASSDGAEVEYPLNFRFR